MPWTRHDLALLTTLVVPTSLALSTRGVPLIRRELDSVGHVWTVWNGSLGDPTRSELVAWPDGADLLPILGGWLDIFLGSTLVRLGMSAQGAFDLVLLGYLILAGIGVALLARTIGAPNWAAALGGALAQLDPVLHHHLQGGRSEQLATGFLALAFASALACWRRPGAWRWLACGLAGAAVVYASWEYGFWLAFAMAWLTPFLLWTGRPEGAVRRWGLAALTCVLVVGPFAALFLVRSAEVRDLQEGLAMLEVAPLHSVPLLGWFVDSDAMRVGTPLLLALLTLPFTVRREDRRLLAGVLSGLLLCLILALGPQPGLWEVGDLGSGAWAPYAALQSTPILGWFHTPDRLLIGWNLTAAVASALLFAAVWRRPWPVLVRAPLIVGALVALALGNHSRAREVRSLHYTPWIQAEDPALELVRSAEVEGALMDLPPRQPGIQSLIFMERQLQHQRPSPYHATLPHLTSASVAKLAERYHLVAWLGSQPSDQEPPTAAEVGADVELLRDDGYAFLALNMRMIPRSRRPTAIGLMRDTLGKPYAVGLEGWKAWSLTGLEPPPEAVKEDEPPLGGREPRGERRPPAP